MVDEIHSDPAGYETLEIFSKTSAINQWLYDEIKNFISGQIMEIGSGIGNISSYLLASHANVSLSDLRPEYCQLLQENFGKNTNLRKVYELDLSLSDFNVKYADLLEKFDTVLALNVIEHIENDSLAVQNAISLLRKHGKLIILVPAGKSLFNSLDRELGHCKRYSKTGLIKLNETAGLDIQYGRYFNAAGIFGWWFAGNILQEKMITSSKLNLFNTWVPLFRMMDKLITPFTGLSVISVGVRN